MQIAIVYTYQLIPGSDQVLEQGKIYQVGSMVRHEVKGLCSVSLVNIEPPYRSLPLKSYWYRRQWQLIGEARPTKTEKGKCEKSKKYGLATKKKERVSSN